MITHPIVLFLQGATLAIPAAVMPGPFQAFLLAQAIKNGWKRTFSAAFAPLFTDGPIIALVLFALTKTPQWFLNILQLAGGLFILYLSRGIFTALKDASQSLEPTKDMARMTLAKACLINILNPNPYIFWSVAAGPIVLEGWRESPILGISFLAGFYGTFVCALFSLIFIFSTAGMLNPIATRVLRAISGWALLAFGLYQIGSGIWTLVH